LDLDNVHVGLRARIWAVLEILATCHQLLAPWPLPVKHHVVPIAVTGVLNVDAFAREEVRGENQTPRDGGEDVSAVVHVVIDLVEAGHKS